MWDTHKSIGLGQDTLLSFFNVFLASGDLINEGQLNPHEGRTGQYHLDFGLLNGSFLFLAAFLLSVFHFVREINPDTERISESVDGCTVTTNNASNIVLVDLKLHRLETDEYL